jgi:hypothetical protein
MKGKLIKTEEGWMVGTVCYADIWSELLPLHPDDVEQINRDAQVFDNIEARIAAYPEVEFEIVQYDGKTPISEGWSGYAKLVNH